MMQKNKIYCMDCIEGLRNQIGDKSIHLAVTSPPYNLAKKYGKYSDNLPYEEYIEWLVDVFRECYRVLVEGGRLCINVGFIYVSKKCNTHACKSDVIQILPTYSDLIVRLRQVGYTLQEHIVWNKIGNSNSKVVFGSYPFPCDVHLKQSNEHILVFKKGLRRSDVSEKRKNLHNKIGKDDYFTYTNPIWTFNGERMDNHCAPFPVELPRRLIRMFSFEGDVVLDTFMGIGTTAVACKLLNRNYLGFELNKKWADYANKRVKNTSRGDSNE